MVKWSSGMRKNFIRNVQFEVLVLVTTGVNLLTCDAM